jgi:hypothetical protein
MVEPEIKKRGEAWVTVSAIGLGFKALIFMCIRTHSFLLKIMGHAMFSF